MIDPAQFTQHTPGPWKTSEHNNFSFGDDRGHTLHVYGPDHHHIAEVTMHEGEPDESDALREEDQANASLMAAGPDLLAQNKRLRETLRRVVREARRLRHGPFPETLHHFAEIGEMASEIDDLLAETARLRSELAACAAGPWYHPPEEPPTKSSATRYFVMGDAGHAIIAVWNDGWVSNEIIAGEIVAWAEIREPRGVGDE